MADEKDDSGFISLALSDEEREERFGRDENGKMVVPDDAPRFDYGLTLNIGGEILRRMGIKKLEDMPKAGEYVAVIGIGLVRSVRYDDNENEERLGTDIQLHEMIPLKMLDEYGPTEGKSEGENTRDDGIGRDAEIRSVLRQALKEI